jgi:hypothetical protein
MKMINEKKLKNKLVTMLKEDWSKRVIKKTYRQ